MLVDGFFGNAQARGDGRVRQTVQFAQGDDLAVAGREGFEGVGQNLFQFAVLDLFQCVRSIIHRGFDARNS